MALTYSYTDDFVVNSVLAADLEVSETKALADLAKQGVTDTFYLEEMCKALVYIDLGGKQLEAEGMKDKVDHYRKEYNRYNKMNLHDDTDEGVYSALMGRA